jgi:hypothetical protein
MGYEAAYRQRVVKGLARKAATLGYRLEPVSAAGKDITSVFGRTL